MEDQNQLPESAPSPTVLTPNSSLPKKSLFIFFIAVASTLLIVLGGLYVANQQKLKSITDFDSCVKAGNPVTESYPSTCRTSDGRTFIQKLSNDEQKNLQHPSSLQSSTSAETSTWKTYTNSDYGYTIQYPGDWTTDVWPIGAQFMPKDEHVINFGKYKLPSSSSEKDYEKLGYMVEITVDKGKTLSTVIKEEDSNNKDRGGYKKEKTTFNGLPAYKTYNTGFDHPRDNLLFENGEKVYRISTHYFVPDESLKQEAQKIYNQILSTFKFL